MIVIIDAYNVLKHTSDHHIHDEHRNAYIDRIHAYCHAKKHEAWIVFDGGAYMYPVVQRYGLVTIVYSGERETADAYIQRSIHNKPVDNTVLVSSDNDIVQYAQQYGYISIEPSVFAYYVDRALHPEKEGMYVQEQPLRKRPSHDSTPDVDRLMEMSSDCILYKEEDMAEGMSENVHTGAHRPSRREKVLYRMMRKL